MEPDNNSFKPPNSYETMEPNTHVSNSPPPGSQSPILPALVITVKVEKHPCFAHHQHILQTMDQLASTDHYPLAVKPFRLFTLLQDYTFTDVLVRAHMGAKSINRHISMYLPGHPSFKSHKDVFKIIDQASRVMPLVSFPPSFFLPILLIHPPF